MNNIIETKQLRLNSSAKKLKVLLIKPFQHDPNLMVYSPPLGLLSLIASIQQAMGEYVEASLLDMKIQHLETDALASKIDTFQPDVIGFSALNCEAGASKEAAALIKRLNPKIITVIGGPYVLHRAEEILSSSHFDWAFSGPADITFPEALCRLANQEALGTDLQGFSYRQENGLHVSNSQDNPDQLDELPMPAWDDINFDQYGVKTRFGAMSKTKRYALLFTSRGCPYLCNYCHDIFTKRFVYQSSQRVISDIAYLYEKHGVKEFQIVDDIFNLHKPRLKEVMTEVIQRWPGKLHFSFPNGLRADILDAEVIRLLCEAGTFSVALAIETVTPRLQRLIEKDLELDKTKWAISEFNKYGVVVSGFFMLGFPTETVEEIEETIRYALDSDLTLANFFTVTPQPKTPLYPLAEKENKAALEYITRLNESGGGSHRSDGCWYQQAHGYPLDKVIRKTIFKFYLSPKRLWRVWCRVPKRMLLNYLKIWFALVFVKNEIKSEEPLVNEARL